MRCYQMRVRPLNHTDWMFRPIGTSSKHEDRVGQRIRDYDLIMNCVVHETMDSTSEHRPLSGKHSFRGHLSICQPGKGRDTRLGYTIRDKNLVSFRVVGQRHGIAESWRGTAGRSAPNLALRNRIATGSAVEGQRRMVTPIRDPNLALLRVNCYTHGMIDARFVAVNDSNGCDVTICLAVKNADRTIAVVRNDDGIVNGIVGHAHGPIQSRLRSLQHAQRLHITFFTCGVKRNRGWSKLSRFSRNIRVQRGVTPATHVLDHSPEVAVVGYANFIVCFVPINSVGIRQTCIYAANQPRGSFDPLHLTAVKDDGVLNFNRNGKLIALVAQGQTPGLVRNREYSSRFGISHCFVGHHHNRVLDVVICRIDFAMLPIQDHSGDHSEEGIWPGYLMDRNVNRTMV